MKKHLTEENLDLSLDSLNIILFLLFLFSFNLVHAQINTNNFINIDKIDVRVDYNRIYDLDFDNDNLIDLLLINKSNRDYSLIRNLFTKDQRIINQKFWLNLSSLSRYRNDNNIIYYFLASRKDKSVSLVYFTNYGSLIIKETLKLNSFPSKVFTANFRNRGKSQSVIYGPSFSGISLITENKFKLYETNIVKENSYSEVFANDFNGDTYLDLAALNTLNNSFEIYSNDQSGSFYFDRKINLQRNEVFQLYSDFNNDSFLDFVTSLNNSVNIYYGDSVYSFSNKLELNINEPVKKVIAADINYNNTKDIIYINKNQTEIKALFSKEENSYQKPITLLNGNNFEDIRITRRGILNRLLAVDSKGKLFSVSYLRNKESEFHISLGDSLTNIFSNENILGAVNPEEKKLHILKHENDSFIYNDFNLSKPFSNLLSFKDKHELFLVFYNRGEKFVEAFQIDSLLTLKQKTNFYLAENISSLIYDKSSNQITAFTTKGDSYSLQNLSLFNAEKEITKIELFLISNSAVDKDVVNIDSTFISYLSMDKEGIHFNLSLKNKMIFRDLLRVKINTEQTKNSVKSFNRNNRFFSIINVNESKEYLVYNRDELKKYKSDFYFDPKKLQLITYKRKDRFVYLDEQTNNLYWIKVSIADKYFAKELLLKNVNADDFSLFVYNNIPMIVYFDNSEKLLTFKEIPFND